MIVGKVFTMHFVTHNLSHAVRTALIASLLFFPIQARSAQNSPDQILKVIRHIVDDAIVPAYDNFAQKAQILADAVDTHCLGPHAQRAFRDAFLAWQKVQHLHLEPSQTENRQHRIQFWPDPKNIGQRQLKKFLKSFSSRSLTEKNQKFDGMRISVAVQGFPALERLLSQNPTSSHETVCIAASAISRNIATIAHDILHDWRQNFRQKLLTPTASDPLFRTPEDSLRAMYTAFSTLLQTLGNIKLNRPLGLQQGRPRPKRGESWRSGLTLEAMKINLQTALDMYTGRPHHPGLGGLVDPQFSIVNTTILHGLSEAHRLLADVQQNYTWEEALTQPAGHQKMRLIQAHVDTAYRSVAEDLSGILGLGLGFNALDGD